jgi:hypothetical protein
MHHTLRQGVKHLCLNGAAVVVVGGSAVGTLVCTGMMLCGLAYQRYACVVIGRVALVTLGDGVESVRRPPVPDETLRHVATLCPSTAQRHASRERSCTSLSRVSRVLCAGSRACLGGRRLPRGPSARPGG